MKTVSIVNLKGGVGKTITAVNMAAILATEHEQRVLLIDADHQGNTTKFYRVPTDSGTLTDLLTGMESYYPNLVHHTIYRNLDVIPADLSLSDLDISSLKNGVCSSETLIDLKNAIIEDDEYDFVVVDCPPFFSAACINAIAASDDVIIPIKLDMFSTDGMEDLSKQISGVQRVHPNVRIAGCLVTMWHNCNVIRQGEEWLRGNAPCAVFDTCIRRTDKVDESTYSRTPIVEWSPRSSAATDYRAFVQEYLGGMNHGKEI